MVVSDFGFTMRPSRRDLVLVLAEDSSAIVTRLQEDGYSVVAATNGEEASALLVVAHARAAVVGVHRGEFRAPPSLVCVFLGSAEQAQTTAAAIGVNRFAAASSAQEACDLLPSLLSPG